ncbi:MAG: multifunctional oxoglutarate decarboxylase/oxoglutarate dehydrogenase thiamine pyrophosphate-binding subunit/dihydrolipoyllysine-residue succinyltransferase subunit, partial [Ilumatobacter sp.]
MSDPASPSFGANSWLVEEMFERFRDDPDSVGESWREFFEDYRSQADLTSPNGVAVVTPAPEANGDSASAAAPAPSPDPATAPAPKEPAPAPAPDPEGAPIRGVGARIVENMEASLGVPTATSFRNIPAKLLEVNRKVINGYRARSGQGKVSFTHLIGFAIVRAIA